MKQKKDLVLEAAKCQFFRYGFKKTTVDDICRESKISKKTFYEIFKGKEDILVTLFIREALIARRAVLSKTDKINDPKEKINTFFRVAEDYFKEEQFMVKVLKDDRGLYSPFLHKKYFDLVENGILNILSDILQEGIRKREFRKLDSRFCSYIIFKLFQAVTYADTSQKKSKAEKDKWINNLLDVIYNGIVSQ